MPHKTQFQRRRNFVKTKNLNEMEIEEKEESGVAQRPLGAGSPLKQAFFLSGRPW